MADYIRVEITVVHGDRSVKASTRRPLHATSAPGKLDAHITSTVKEVADIVSAAIKRGDDS